MLEFLVVLAADDRQHTGNLMDKGSHDVSENVSYDRQS